MIKMILHYSFSFCLLIALTACPPPEQEPYFKISFQNSDGLSLVERHLEDARWEGYSITGISYRVLMDYDGQSQYDDIEHMKAGDYASSTQFNFTENKKMNVTIQEKYTRSGVYHTSNYSWTEFIQSFFISNVSASPETTKFGEYKHYRFDIRGGDVTVSDLEVDDEYYY